MCVYIYIYLLSFTWNYGTVVAYGTIVEITMMILISWGPRIAKLPYEWLNSMVNGRYKDLGNGVYKSSYIFGAPSCVKTTVAYIYIST